MTEQIKRTAGEEIQLDKKDWEEILRRGKAMVKDALINLEVNKEIVARAEQGLIDAPERKEEKKDTQ